MITDGATSMANLEQAVNQISEAKFRIETLGNLIAEIGEKTELIDEIVFQTRLLSFNASVEAERAGEHGRGFAVVAQEVGNLAQMSGKSASEIVQIVKKSIKEAKEVVDLSHSKTAQGVALCKKTSEQLKLIESASKEILEVSENILRSSVEQSSGVAQINQSIQLLNKTTQDNTAMAQAFADDVVTLENQSGHLALALGDLSILANGKNSKPPLAETAAQPPAATITKIKSSNRNRPNVTKTSQKPSEAPTYGNLAVKQNEDPWEKL